MLKKKLITVGNSRAVTIPDEWLKFQEQRIGKPIDSLLMEVNNKLIIRIDEPTVSTYQLTKWARAVKKRDKHTCQRCGCISHKNIAHHIKEIKYFPELALDIGNGETLCQPCHIKFHKGGSNGDAKLEPAARPTGPGGQIDQVEDANPRKP